MLVKCQLRPELSGLRRQSFACAIGWPPRFADSDCPLSQSSQLKKNSESPGKFLGVKIFWLAQTRMCRFPASGSSWESLAHGGADDNGGARICCGRNSAGKLLKGVPTGKLRGQMIAAEKLETVPRKTELAGKRPAQVNAVTQLRLQRVWRCVVEGVETDHYQSRRLQRHGSPRKETAASLSRLTSATCCS